MFSIIRVLTLYFFIISCSGVFGVKDNDNWGYRNKERNILPKQWPTKWPLCGSKNQSPINIQPKHTSFDPKLKKFTINKKKINGLSIGNNELWEIRNSLLTVNLFPKSHEFTFNTENEKFKLVQLHFHWRGSEHSFDSRLYAGEIHLVHRSVKDPNKLAVIAYLLKENSCDNKNLSPISEQLVNVIKVNSQKETSSFKLSKLIPFTLKNYYRYSGSLTIPDCRENVQWFVAKKLLPVSNKQLLDFQSIEDKFNYPVLTNSRPVEKVNQRVVRRSFKFSKNPKKYY